MKINQKDLDKYKEIYKEEYGEEISNDKAFSELSALLCLMDAVYRHQNRGNYTKD
jgi:hypothetical protein